jgi:DNA-binding winged helix-turn-helix (wHTH) protein/WD40 repeat protein
VKIEDLDLGERPFRVGPWVVEPRLNRISRGDTTIQLELRIMDVLVYLASRAGEVVPRREIVDSVWATEVISDNTLTHTIAEIRNALGDDVKNPTFLETIHRKGYRLIAPVTVEEIRLEDRSISAVDRGPTVDVADPNPYPGLAAYAEKDAEFFFGREVEVGQMWRKLTARRLLALIGPSGVGKTSFLRAGIVPAKPEGWGVVACEPGEAPFAALAKSLVPEFSGDSDAMSKLVHLKKHGQAIAMVIRWRSRHDQALLIVDQFEELFTLNPEPIQRRFAELVRRLVDEADVHALIGIRDDYLHRCHEHRWLEPIFDSLTVIRAPEGDSLRRALVEPARRLGYVFENEQLVEEMVSSVEGERGALPLLAFAVARMWDLRDREQLLLTVKAYEEIGGVAGALARHAEAILKAVGDNRLPIVREIFRNLVTADGTRASRSVDDVLSIFDSSVHDRSSESVAQSVTPREVAAEVLARLCDARLLTCFEEEGSERLNSTRVEVVHESLLESWPRLVGWRTQEADSARFRDEFRQAAKMWIARDRSPDLLWTGSAFNEYRLWRAKFPGGLCADEEEFGRAMTALARKRRRKRRGIAAGIAFSAVALAVVFGMMWRQSVHALRRAEASELLAIGASHVDSDPVVNCSSTALAFAIASLEARDSREARMFALQALWRGAVGYRVEHSRNQMFFTSEDRRLVACATGGIRRYKPNGELEFELMDLEVAPWYRHAISPVDQGDLISVWNSMLGVVSLWPTAGSQPLQRTNIGRHVRPILVTPDELLTLEVDDGGIVARRWPSAGGGPIRLAAADAAFFSIERDLPLVFLHQDKVVSFRAGDVWLHDLTRWGERPQPIGFHDSRVAWGSFNRRGDLVATVDENGGVKIWEVPRRDPEPLRVFQGPRMVRTVDFDAHDRHLAAGGHDSNATWVWELHGPPTAAPRIFSGGSAEVVSEVAFSASGEWLASSYDPPNEGSFLWPLEQGRPYVIAEDVDPVGTVRFSGDSERLYGVMGDGNIYAWPLNAELGQQAAALADGRFFSASDIAVNNTGSLLLASGKAGVWLRDLGGSDMRRLRSSSDGISGAAFSLDGRYASAVGIEGDDENRDSVVWLWDLESGESRTLGRFDHVIWQVAFSPQGDRLYTASIAGIFSLDVLSGEVNKIGQETGSIAVSPDGERLFVARVAHTETKDRAGFYDLSTGEFSPLAFHGDPSSIALGADGSVVVTGNNDGEIRVGRSDGSEPHLLLGHGDRVEVSVSPDGRWIASASRDGTIRLWPMPDLDMPPLHTLPREELIAKLKTFTNLRIARDGDSSTGWKVEVGPFPGWENVPTW